MGPDPGERVRGGGQPRPVPQGSEFVEGVNAISGERCSPHPHEFSDRVLRPGDPAYFDILHSYNGYRTCYYRTFAVCSASPPLVDAYKRCRYYLDTAIDRIRPGVTTGEMVQLWPKAEEFGFPDEEAAFALQYGHGVGLSMWEKPLISRLVSLDHPELIEEGMVFALETFWPSTDGWSAARIEEQLVVTEDGCEVITRFPAEELLIAGKPYYTVGGALPLEREVTSDRNTMLDADARGDAHSNGAVQPRQPRCSRSAGDAARRRAAGRGASRHGLARAEPGDAEARQRRDRAARARGRRHARLPAEPDRPRPEDQPLATRSACSSRT